MDIPEPDISLLYKSFVENLPRFDYRPAVAPAFSTNFLSLLSPLLRARLAYNLPTYQPTTINPDANVENDESELCKWAELLTFKRPYSTSPDVIEEYGPAELLRKLYTDAADERTNQVIKIFYARLDEETFHVTAALIPRHIEMTWEWVPVEKAWLVRDVFSVTEEDCLDKQFLEPSTAHFEKALTQAIATLADDKDDEDDEAYFEAYDRHIDGEIGAALESNTPHDFSDDDDEAYYSRYDNVGTVIVPEDDTNTTTTECAVPQAVRAHIQTTVRSLIELSSSCNMPKLELAKIFRQELQRAK
ncbi:uncharacterized protein V1518DRAFT_427535 [Limtongia smithiae]|uniref:uncharacterized protein n=1 Tax=Limtongia smithiae TaxID=1125753 RepID=UPI0034CFEA31